MAGAPPNHRNDLLRAVVQGGEHGRRGPQDIEDDAGRGAEIAGGECGKFGGRQDDFDLHGAIWNSGAREGKREELHRAFSWFLAFGRFVRT